MKRGFLFFFLWLNQAQAQIFIQGPGLTPEEFSPLVEARQGLRLSDWVLTQKSSKDILPLLHSLGTDFIQGKIDTKKFKSDLQQIIGDRILNHETRLLLLDIYTQKLNSSLAPGEKKTWLEASCHLLQLEDHWEDGYLIQKRGCPYVYSQRRIQEFLSKFKARVFIEGVELKESSNFLTFSRDWKYHWHILSDNGEPLFIKASVDELLSRPSFRDVMAQGSCQNPLINRRALEKTGVTLKNAVVIYDRNCFQAVETAPIPTPSSSWKKPALIILGLVAVSASYTYLKDHEIVFEF